MLPHGRFLTGLRTVNLVFNRKNHTHSEPLRNYVGVQMLNRELHRQIFKGHPFPPPDPRAVVIAKQHLKMHGLDPKGASQVPDIGFPLPFLQGRNIEEHFHNIGSVAAEPWLSFCQDFVNASLPPKPVHWKFQSGWMKYPGGDSSSATPVECPDEEDNALVFDVETMPKYGSYPVMAIAASHKAWYAWISPWITEESDDVGHLIPLGNPSISRAIIGHNVSFDRARIKEEYSILQNRNRFIDTMALHIAIKGMSSGQRPAWIKFNKLREEQEEALQDTADDEDELQHQISPNDSEDSDLEPHLRRANVTKAETLHPNNATTKQSERGSSWRWEEVTSANSLAHVARLHCGIHVDKSIRQDFLTASRVDIHRNLGLYLSYCAEDVSITHAVFQKVFPAFLKTCPSPVSFAGVLTMGSSFLPVNETWNEYIYNAETKFRELEESVKSKLRELAEDARSKMQDGSWTDDVWLSQLNWTAKTLRRRSCGHHDGVGLTHHNGIKEVSQTLIPRWYNDLLQKGPFHSTIKEKVVGLLLKFTYREQPVLYSQSDGWHFYDKEKDMCLAPIPRVQRRSGKVRTLFSQGIVPLVPRSGYEAVYRLLLDGEKTDPLSTSIMHLAQGVLDDWKKSETSMGEMNPWLKGLDWSLVRQTSEQSTNTSLRGLDRPVYPTWYAELLQSRKISENKGVDITVRNRISPLLLKLKWRGFPLFHSREHGWIFRVPAENRLEPTQKALHFMEEADADLRDASMSEQYLFYKLPHKDGEHANVGSPLAKTFIKYLQDGTLTSPVSVAKEALDMNVQCSYWISARDRVLNQIVQWDHQNGVDLGLSVKSSPRRWGLILPQVITMGTVTRRAIEKTWLTASNAKSNRVGSELKAMIRAPEGYAIVGADVDSEELWISSVMGDAQFGFHGATAVSWMTLEGTKATKTDLHSKTATILGINRDAAKVFNYSRIYGAGMRHAEQLLLQGNANLQPKIAKSLAEELYNATKGKKSNFLDTLQRKIWFGGSESFVFNKLEEIAMSNEPTTPALGCGITSALQKKYLPSTFGSNYLPSRINWVVQSSGVDYLHLLIVAMEYLIKHYSIRARYLISVHDEIRFLVDERDKYLAALALQVANLWTRCHFAYKLGMDDLPQSIAFFSAVDIDSILRKEVFMTCETPSHRSPLAPGESLGIDEIINKVVDLPWQHEASPSTASSWNRSGMLSHLQHRASSVEYLQVQATSQLNEIKDLAAQLSAKHGKRVPLRA